MAESPIPKALLEPCHCCGGSGRLPHARLAGAYLRRLREEARLTTTEVARRLGVTPASVCDWEMGRRRVPRPRWNEYLEAVGVI